MEQSHLQQEINISKNRLRKLPEGKLICTKNSNRSKWYVSINNQITYLPKSQRALAEQLAERRYLEAIIDDDSRKLSAANSYLKKYPSSCKSEVLLDNPFFSDLFNLKHKNIDQYILDWCNAPYEKLEEYPEKLIHNTVAGIKVRSKSEVMIVSALVKFGIPFRYECKLNLASGIFVYPDFTIMHPITGQLFYWEHLGLMDNPEYLSSTSRKIRTYGENGIYLNINLITTSETQNHPLDPNIIDDLIKIYLM